MPEEETKDETFVKGISNKSFGTTKSYNDDRELDKIYVGGYSDISKYTLEKYRVKPTTNNDLLAAGVDLDNLDNIPKIRLDGKDVLVADIVAKSAIPYPTTIKRRFINALQTDPIINTIFTVITHYIFNVNRRSILRPIGHYRTKTIKELEQMLENIIPKDIQEKQINFLDNVDTYSHVWEDFAPYSLRQTLGFGTGGFWKELLTGEDIVNDNLDINIPIGTPCVLKNLHPFYFEKVYQNRLTFEPLFLEYNDLKYKLVDDEVLNKGDLNPNIKSQFENWKQLIIRDPVGDTDSSRKNLLLPLNQLVIYRNSPNIAPNVEFFGTSRIFSIVPVSEIQREIVYNILPNVNKTQSQGSGYTTTRTRNQKKLQTIVDALEQGSTHIVTNIPDLKYEEVKISVDLPGIEQERLSNVRHELMGLNFPSPMINFENITNRDTVRIVAEFFKNTNLEPLRQVINKTMADQWYLPLIVFFFNNVLGRGKDKGDNQSEQSKKEQRKYDFIELKLQIITEFENIDFALFEDKLKALNNIMFLADYEKREMVRLDPYPVNDAQVESQEQINDTLKEIGDIKNRPKNPQLQTPQEMAKEIQELRAQLKGQQKTFEKAAVKEIANKKRPTSGRTRGVN